MKYKRKEQDCDSETEALSSQDSESYLSSLKAAVENEVSPAKSYLRNLQQYPSNTMSSNEKVSTWLNELTNPSNKHKPVNVDDIQTEAQKSNVITPSFLSKRKFFKSRDTTLNGENEHESKLGDKSDPYLFISSQQPVRSKRKGRMTMVSNRPRKRVTCKKIGKFVKKRGEDTTFSSLKCGEDTSTVLNEKQNDIDPLCANDNDDVIPSTLCVDIYDTFDELVRNSTNLKQTSVKKSPNNHVDHETESSDIEYRLFKTPNNLGHEEKENVGFERKRKKTQNRKTIGSKRGVKKSKQDTDIEDIIQELRDVEGHHFTIEKKSKISKLMTTKTVSLEVENVDVTDGNDELLQDVCIIDEKHPDKSETSPKNFEADAMEVDRNVSESIRPLSGKHSEAKDSSKY